jgi:hypothetical protein
MMQRCALGAASTFFQHRKYCAFKCHLTNKFKTVDHFLTNIRLSKRIVYVRPIMGGPVSHHDPIILKLQFKQKRKRNLPPKLAKVRISGTNSMTQKQQSSLSKWW